MRRIEKFTPQPSCSNSISGTSAMRQRCRLFFNRTLLNISHGKMTVHKRFNWVIFLVTLILLCILAFFSFFAAWARDDGTLSEGFLPNLLADLFLILRFPTHTLFWNYMNGDMFLFGLLINCILYSFLIERLIQIMKRTRTSGRISNSS